MTAWLSNSNGKRAPDGGKIKKYLNIETRILVYKQTILPLSEYVSFVLCMNTKHDVEKLQRQQNRALRMIYNIQNTRDIGVDELHRLTNIDMLHIRRKAQLFNIMYTLKKQLQFEQIRDRNT